MINGDADYFYAVMTLHGLGMAGTAFVGGFAGVAYAWTLGFSAFTSYSYALVKAGPLPRAAPDISFVDQFGNQRRLASLRGRHVLLHAFNQAKAAV
jgi:hypothetical protein